MNSKLGAPDSNTEFVKILQKLGLLSLIWLSIGQVQGRQVLAELDFSTGNWVMIGVSLRNATLHPIQDTLGTFICKDKTVLAKIKEEWDFSPMFEDVCDYHYAIKFYRDGELKQTLRVNLNCRYITVGGAAFDFTPQDLLKYRPSFKGINWSRITFRNIDVLKEAVRKMLELPNVYAYQDIRPYQYTGFFTVGYENLPWNSDKDSLTREVTKEIRAISGRRDFYVAPTFVFVQGDWMKIRYEVYCNSDFLDSYRGPVTAGWRSHLEYSDQIQVVMIGLSRENYQKIMAPVLQGGAENPGKSGD